MRLTKQYILDYFKEHHKLVQESTKHKEYNPSFSKKLFYKSSVEDLNKLTNKIISTWNEYVKTEGTMKEVLANNILADIKEHKSVANFIDEVCLRPSKLKDRIDVLMKEIKENS